MCFYRIACVVDIILLENKRIKLCFSNQIILILYTCGLGPLYLARVDF